MFIILTLLIHLNIYAQTNSAIVLGGNCEEKHNRYKTQNIFLDSITTASNALKSAGWNVTTLYDNDIKTAESKLNSNNDLHTSKKADLYAALDKYIYGKTALKKGDQLLININTHGSPDGSFCMSDDESFSASDFKFKEKLYKLKSKGVKIGFIAETCYSGSLIPELSRFGCVISSQSKNAVSFNNPLENSLIELLNLDEKSAHKLDLAKPTNLAGEKDRRLTFEELFLKSLAANETNSIPNIPNISGFHHGKILSEQYMGLLSHIKTETSSGLSQIANCENCSATNLAPFINSQFDPVESLIAPLRHEDDLKLLASYFGDLAFPSIQSVLLLNKNNINKLSSYQDEFKKLADEYQKLSLELSANEIPPIHLEVNIKSFVPNVLPDAITKVATIEAGPFYFSYDGDYEKNGLVHTILTPFSYAGPGSTDWSKVAHEFIMNSINKKCIKALNQNAQSQLEQTLAKKLEMNANSEFNKKTASDQKHILAQQKITKQLNDSNIAMNKIIETMQSDYNTNDLTMKKSMLKAQALLYLHDRIDGQLNKKDYESIQNCSDFTLRKLK